MEDSAPLTHADEMQQSSPAARNHKSCDRRDLCYVLFTAQAALRSTPAKIENMA